MYYVTKVNFKNKATTSIFYGIIIIIFLSIAHGIVKGKHMSESNREALNTERTKDNNSAIVSPLSTSTWYGETVGIIYGFFEINIPIIEGFKHILSPQIISFIIWQLLLFYISLLCKTINKAIYKSCESSSFIVSTQMRYNWIILIESSKIANILIFRYDRF